jgi:hypothetical protein
MPVAVLDREEPRPLPPHGTSGGHRQAFSAMVHNAFLLAVGFVLGIAYTRHPVPPRAIAIDVLCAVLILVARRWVVVRRNRADLKL